jgi:hypothetical protein
VYIWGEIKSKVTKFLPKLGETGRWTEIIYEATSDTDALATSRGRLLFQFDPEQVKSPSRRAGKDTKMAVMWVETREVHRDEWQ